MPSPQTATPASSAFPQPTMHYVEDTSSPQQKFSNKQQNKGGNGRKLAKALGWFSIGLGAAQILTPRAMGRVTGVGNHPALMRAVGMREMASGVGILKQRKPAGWLWSRVAGDAMDLAMLSAAAASSHSRRKRVTVAAAAVAGIAVLDLIASMQQSEQKKLGANATDSGAVLVEKSLTVNRSAQECYDFWRNFDNFPYFMKHVESVQSTSDKRSHWKVKAPLGRTVEWDAEITEEQPNRLLAWHSVEGADVDHAGTVTFEPAPGGRGTVVRVQLQYKPPAGTLGVVAAKLFGEEPAQQIDEDLRHFKHLIETGEIPTTVGQTAGKRSMKSRLLFRKGAPG